MANFKKFHRLRDYYRHDIELDTAHDARHLLSVFTSFYPDIYVDFYDSYAIIRNICNTFGLPLTIRWRTQI